MQTYKHIHMYVHIFFTLQTAGSSQRNVGCDCSSASQKGMERGGMADLCCSGVCGVWRNTNQRCHCRCHTELYLLSQNICANVLLHKQRWRTVSCSPLRTFILLSLHTATTAAATTTSRINKTQRSKQRQQQQQRDDGQH